MSCGEIAAASTEQQVIYGLKKAHMRTAPFSCPHNLAKRTWCSAPEPRKSCEIDGMKQPRKACAKLLSSKVYVVDDGMMDAM